MKHNTSIGLALISALGGAAIFVWMANWPQPQHLTRIWFFYFGELFVAAVILGCGFAALFAPIARSLDLEGRACEVVGYVLTVIGVIGNLNNHRAVWALCLILIGFPVGKLCRRLAYPYEERDNASVPHPFTN